ncbi:MAG TPA: hypothetical protein VG826_18170 [Pirellulales bacterium]|nr:hypothetical protein [Pirellulales bacterium]
MEENRKKRGGAWAVVLVAIMLVAYPLGTGPAVMMIGASGCNRTCIRVFKLVYTPLDLVPESLLRPWVELWDIYDITYGGKGR